MHTDRLTAVPAGCVVIRTYESFDIVWERGSTWTNFDSAEEAQSRIKGSEGRVVRKTWEHRFTSSTLLGIANPGIAERVEQAEEVA